MRFTALALYSLSCLTLMFLAFSCAGPSVPPADLVLLNGKIATVDEDFSFAEAVAVTDGRITKVGTTKDIEAYIGPDTERIDCEGRLVTPGLIDAHGHVLSLGDAIADLDFRGTKSFEEIIGMIADYAATRPAGEWIFGSNWDQEDWPEGKFPWHDKLSKAVPDHPVWISRVDYHAMITNDLGLKIAGITRDTKDPEGGEILRKANGEPTGVFVDNAISLVSKHIPDTSQEQIRERLVLASESCLSVGLTGVHDAGCSPAMIENYKKIIDEGKLGIRIYAMLGNPHLDDVTEYLTKNKVDNYGDNMLKVNCIKLFMDGAMGSRGALLFEDYSDRSGYRGLATLSYEDALAISRAALKTGCQVATHAIGDKANRLILDAYEKALAENPKDDHRFRVEHAQVLAPEDFKRFKPLGVLPSMQPTHATSDMYWAEDRLGPVRVKGSYALGSVLREGNIIPCGSDFPVEENNPMLGVYAAITRQDPSGWPEGGWFPDQCMTREQVLRGFTIWAAYASFQDDILGSIEEGKLADMTILSKDILTVDPKEILTTESVMTIVGGEVKYRRN